MIRQHRNKNNSYSHSASARSRLAHFQQIHRKNYIQSIITQMRQHFANGQTQHQKYAEDIDLHMCFREIDNIRDIRYEFEKLSSILSTLLQYCRHTLLDDMYCLMSEETLSHLTDMLECKNIQAFEGNAKVYVKLHWIVGNYCYYACTAPSNYFSLMNQLLQNILSNQNFYEQQASYLFFSHQQTKQIINLIFFGLCSIQLRSGEVLDYFIGHQHSIIPIAIKQATKLARYFQNQRVNQHDTTVSIAHFILKVFENFLQLSLTAQQEQNKDQLQGFRPHLQSLPIVESLDIEIINLLLDMLENGNSLMEEYIADCLCVYLASNLDAKPEILLGHKFNIVPQYMTKSIIAISQLQQLYPKQGDKQKYNKQTNISHLNAEEILRQQQQMLVRWLEIIFHIFAVNFPNQDDLLMKQQQIKQRYQQILIDWFQKYILQALVQTMKMLQHLKSKEIVMISMNILQHICCDETLCQILMHHPQLLHLIFSNCKYDENNNDLRTQSLLCITNLIQVADGNTLKSKIVDQAKQFDLAIVFANNLGIQFSPEINKKMMQALNRVLQLYSSDKEHQNILLRRICQQGGKQRLLSILDGQGQQWRDSIKMAEYLLERYDSEAI